MSEIVVKKDGDRWFALFGDKRIASSGCRNCVIQAVLAVTKKSSKYRSVTVLNEDGSTERILPTGV